MSTKGRVLNGRSFMPRPTSTTYTPRTPEEDGRGTTLMTKFISMSYIDEQTTCLGYVRSVEYVRLPGCVCSTTRIGRASVLPPSLVMSVDTPVERRVPMFHRPFSCQRRTCRDPSTRSSWPRLNTSSLATAGSRRRKWKDSFIRTHISWMRHLGSLLRSTHSDVGQGRWRIQRGYIYTGQQAFILILY